MTRWLDMFIDHADMLQPAAATRALCAADYCRTQLDTGTSGAEQWPSASSAIKASTYTIFSEGSFQ